MKTRFIVILLCGIWLTLSALEPVYYWNFDSNPPHSIGRNKNRFWGEITPLAGINGSGGMLCGKGRKYNTSSSSGISGPFTVELKFKPDNTDCAGTLFTYDRNSYKRGQFLLRLKPEGRISAEFSHYSDSGKELLKSFSADTSPNRLTAGQWYTVRVSSISEGEIKIYLNNRMILAKQNALDFSDLAGTLGKNYPLIVIGNDISSAKAMEGNYFSGIIDELKIWNQVVEPAVSDTIANTRSQNDPNLGLSSVFEQSSPFRVLDVSTELEGDFAKADEKFVKAAPVVSVRKEDNKLFLRFLCPIPDGERLLTDGSSVWKGDCVEFFIARNDGTYLQYVVNPNGKRETYHWIQHGYANPEFKSQFSFTTKIGKDFWTADLVIPEEELQFSEDAVVPVNFTRQWNSGAMLYTWAPTASFHDVNSFGKLFPHGRKKYFSGVISSQSELISSAKVSVLQAETVKQLQELSEILSVHGDKPEYYDAISSGIFNLEQNCIRLTLEGKSHILWDAPVWGNELVVTPLTRPLEKIVLRSPQNSRLFFGFAMTNLSDKPYLGQIKLLNDIDEKKDFYFSGKLKTNPLSGKIIFREGVPIEDRSGRMLHDPLAELPMNTLVRAGAKQSIPLWMEIDTSGLQTGQYTGVIVLKAGNSEFSDESIDFQLEVTAVDFASITLDNFNYCYTPSYRGDSKKLARMLHRYDINYIYAGTPGQRILDIYPEFDAKGNIIRTRFEPLNRLLQTYDQSRERKIFFFFAWGVGWGSKWHNPDWKSQLITDTPEWNNAMKNFVVALEKYLVDEHGFTSEQIVINTEDEASGDINDPASHVAKAYRYGKLIKDSGAKVRLMLNPHMRAFDVTSRNLKKMSEVYDIFELYRPKLTPELAVFAKTLNRELWVYSILANTNKPDTYRRMSWENMRDGFSSVVASWHFDASHSGGDGFNSRDTPPSRNTNTTDYGVLYVDFDNETFLTSRRAEAHYQGFLDRKAWEYAKKCGVPDAELQKLVEEGLSGGIDKMDSAREAILEAAMKRRKE